MPSFAELMQQSSGHAWLFIPSEILLGAMRSTPIILTSPVR